MIWSIKWLRDSANQFMSVIGLSLYYKPWDNQQFVSKYLIYMYVPIQEE